MIRRNRGMDKLFAVFFIIGLSACGASYDGKLLRCNNAESADARLWINHHPDFSERYDSTPLNRYDIHEDDLNFYGRYYTNLIKETDTHFHFEIGGISVNSNESSVAELLLNKETQILSDRLNGYTFTCSFDED
tara:strand:- start:206 stop:607 length:402 start_codon:yes stop_codon:yes gene_type:complete